MEIKNTHVYGFEDAIRGVRNPMSSWAKSDSYIDDNKNFILGDVDKDLCHRLLSTSSDSDSKFLRMIYVGTDIVAPVYWVNELATYKISTVMDSCSLQHTGMSKNYTIDDFEIDDQRVYDILRPRQSLGEKYPIIIPYETSEYKTYILPNGLKYDVYRNGKIFSQTHSDAIGNIIQSKEIKWSQNKDGYYYVTLGNSEYREKWLVHRLVATMWIPNENNKLEINHKNHKHGDNSIENLEWVTREENEQELIDSGLISKRDIKTRYLHYKSSRKIDFDTIKEIQKKYNNKNSKVLYKDLAEEYNVSIGTIRNVIHTERYVKDFELFTFCENIEKYLDLINKYRQLYKDTGDYMYFRIMRQLIPMSYRYKFTWSANYAVLRNIYRQRKNHRLSEWHEFCRWIDGLPYAEDLITYGIK